MKKEIKIEIPDYSYIERSKIPERFKWNINDTYSNLEEWQKDKALLFKMIDKIEELAKDWTSSPGRMFEMLNHLDEVGKKSYRLFIFTTLLADTDMGNSSFQALKGEIHTINVNLHSMLSFVDPDILKLGKKKVHEYVKSDSRLKVYEFKFESVLRMKKHILPSDKAGIVAQTGLFSEAPEKAAGILNDLDIPAPKVTFSDGKKVRLNTPSYIRYRGVENRKDRRKVMRTYWKHHTGFKNTHAVLLDAAVKNHFFIARVHSYKNCLEAELYPHNIHLSVFHTLIKTVEENLIPLHRYLKLKTRLLHIKKMSYDDIYASSVPEVDRVYTIEEALGIIIEALKPLSKDYTDVLKWGFDTGWMDIYPNKGKRSGAYSNGSLYDVHPYVLMNYNGKFSSVSTLAHEFGHSLHSWFSNQNQPFTLAQYPIFLAEIASTFNETLLVNYLVKNENDDRIKLYILDQYLENFRGTLYRQTLFANFELAMHQQVEEGQTLTPKWLDKKYLDLTRLYYGHKEGIVKVDKYIENEWSAIPHFYYNFYVYQYSTGIVASSALADMVLKGSKKEQKRYLNFLKSGGSKYPLDTLKEVGVDLTTPKPIEIAISKFNEIVEEMEEIVERLD